LFLTFAGPPSPHATLAHAQLLFNARRHFGQGGLKRVHHTLVPLFFEACRLCHAINAYEKAGAPTPNGAPRQVTTAKTLRFMSDTVTVIVKNFPEVTSHLLPSPLSLLFHAPPASLPPLSPAGAPAHSKARVKFMQHERIADENRLEEG